jgi:5-formyltetrahydrofolate cyclo-ligase
MQHILNAKAELRKRAIAARDALDPEYRRMASEALATHGIAFAGRRPGALVSGFTAIGAEIDPLPLMTKLAPDHVLALPVLMGKGQPLAFRRWALGGPLRSGLWGIREPPDDAPVVEPEIVLVPLLAFDAKGRRLGYGAGYYDRTLAHLRSRRPIIAIGLAFDEQEVAEVPVGANDEPLDWVLTPSGPRHTGTRT